jgi:hypothetical protein
VQTEVDQLCGMEPGALNLRLNQHTTQIYAYDGRMAVTLKVPGFSDNSADGSSHCLIYDQAHYLTKSLGDYDYDFGWTQRLVIKVTTLDVKVSVTIPSAVAASCDLGSSTAVVQYVVRGVAGDPKVLSGEAAQFGVDQFAQYRIKMQALFDQLENGKMHVEPVVLARQLRQAVPETNRRDLYRGFAYRLCGLQGILMGHTVDEHYTYMTTKGKDQSGAHQKIDDEAYFRTCIESAYGDYGIANGKRLTDLSKPDQAVLRSTIAADLDGFETYRHGF